MNCPISSLYDDQAPWAPSYVPDEPYDRPVPCLHPGCEALTRHEGQICRAHRCTVCNQEVTPGYECCVDHAIETLIDEIGWLCEGRMSSDEAAQVNAKLVKLVELWRLRGLA